MKQNQSMKNLIPLVMLLAGTAGAFAQGVVNFNNNQLPTGGTNPDRLARGPTVEAILGSDFASPPASVAQLYWSTDGGSSFTAHSAAPARFRPAGVNPSGTWVGGNRTLPAGVGGVGTTILLQVRAWDSVGGTLTYAQAQAQGPLHGSSATFNYAQVLSNPPAP